MTPFKEQLENYTFIYNYILYANILGLLEAKISPEVSFFFNFLRQIC